MDAWCNDLTSDQGTRNAAAPPYGSTAPIPVPEGFDYDMWVGPAPMRPYTADRCTCWGAYHIYDYALGFIAGWGAHPLDIAQWGLDADGTGPVRYEGTGKLPPAGSLWNTVYDWDVRCEYASGVKLRFMSGGVAGPVVRQYHPVFPDHGTTFHGTKGWVSVSRSGLYASDKALQSARVKDDEKHLYATESQARNFIDCVKSRKPTISPLESAIRSDTISHLSDLCVRLGRPIAWDPRKEQIIGDDEATRLLDRPMRGNWTFA